MAVQNHLLSNTILIRPDDNDDSDSSLQGETMKVQVNIPFKYPFLCVCGVCFYDSKRPTHQTEQREMNVLLFCSIVICAHCSLNKLTLLINDVLFVNITYHRYNSLDCNNIIMALYIFICRYKSNKIMCVHFPCCIKEIRPMKIKQWLRKCGPLLCVVLRSSKPVSCPWQPRSWWDVMKCWRPCSR